MTASTLVGLGLVALLGADLVRWTRLQGAEDATSPGLVMRPGHGSLVICGGDRVPEEAWRRFIALAGGRRARILVIPTASRKTDLEGDSARLAEWKSRGVGSAEWLHASTRAEAEDPAFALPLAGATGVWIEGGDQSLIMQAYLDTEVERQLKALLDRGGVIGGTSAGAAVMSRLMIAGGRSEAREGTGFGLLPGTVIDQHFFRRNRVARLLDVLARHRELVGFGIDERTALVIRDERIDVVGDSYVMACVPGPEGGPTRQVILKPGDQVDLPALRHGSDRAVVSAINLGDSLGTVSSN